MCTTAFRRCTVQFTELIIQFERAVHSESEAMAGRVCMKIEQQEEKEFVCVSAMVYMHLMNERSAKCAGPIFLWNEYVGEVLAYTGRFQRQYRMDITAFNQLCRLLEPALRQRHPYYTVCA